MIDVPPNIVHNASYLNLLHMPSAATSGLFPDSSSASGPFYSDTSDIHVEINYSDTLDWINFSDYADGHAASSRISSEKSFGPSLESTFCTAWSGSSMSSHSVLDSPDEATSPMEPVLHNSLRSFEEQGIPSGESDFSKKYVEDSEVSAFISECLMSGSAEDLHCADNFSEKSVRAQSGDLVVPQTDMVRSSWQMTKTESGHVPESFGLPAALSVSIKHEPFFDPLRQEVIHPSFVKAEQLSDTDSSDSSLSFLRSGRGVEGVDVDHGDVSAMYDSPGAGIIQRISQFKQEVSKLDWDTRRTMADSLYKLSKQFGPNASYQGCPDSAKEKSRGKRARKASSSFAFKMFPDELPSRHIANAVLRLMYSPNPDIYLSSDRTGDVQEPCEPHTFTAASGNNARSVPSPLPPINMTSAAAYSNGSNGVNHSLSCCSPMSISDGPSFVDGPLSARTSFSRGNATPKAGEPGSRKRIFFTEYQTRKLNKYYEELAPRGAKCTPLEIGEMARDVGITEHQVRIYFQNKRARTRNRSIEGSSDGPASKRWLGSPGSPSCGRTHNSNNCTSPTSSVVPTFLDKLCDREGADSVYIKRESSSPETPQFRPT